MRHVLLVDSDPLFSTAVQYLFNSEGVQVTAVSNAGDAEKMLQHSDFDGVITNLVLSSSNGYELISHIKLESRNPGMPVLALSEVSCERAIAHSLAAGADTCLQKPVAIPQLLSATRNMFADRGNVAA